MTQASISKRNNLIQNIIENVASRKFIISVLAGILCFFLSVYNISYMVGEIEISITWSLIFPILISIGYGIKAGGISAISGGALYPFLLWPDNGWANVGNSIFLLILIIMVGYIYDNKIWKSIKLRFHYRVIFLSIVIISYMAFSYFLIFNKLLALNPAFWISDTINGLSNSILQKIFIKSIINYFIIIMFSDALIRLPIIRRFLGLNVYFYMRRNTQAFFLSIVIALIIWLSFFILDNILTENIPLQDKSYLSLSFMIIICSGGIIGRILIQYLESKLKTENLLQKNQEKLISAQKLAKLGSWELDINTQVITLSAGHQDLIGEKSQRTTMPLFEYAEKYIVPEDIAIMHEKFDLSVKNIKNKDYSGSFEYRIKTHTGEIKHLSVRGRIKKEGIVIGTIQDISERIQRENVIQEKDETYRRLFETSNVPILILDANFVFIDCNEMASKLLERPKKEILGATPVDETISPKFQPDGRLSSDLGPKIFDSSMQGNDLHFEWTHLKKDGTEFPVEISMFGFIASKKKNFFVMWKDLTEVKRKEKELKKQNLELYQLSDELSEKNRLLFDSKNKFKNLFDKSPVSIWEQDFSETIALLHKKKAETKNLEKYFDENPNFVNKCVSKIKILNVNNQTLELIGVKNLDELVSHIRKSNNKISVNILKNELLSIASGKRDFYGETEFIKTDGSILHAIIKSTMLDDKGKNIASVIDITKIKKVEEELIVAKEKAEQSEEKLKQAQQISHLGHWELDIINNKLEWSDEIFRIFEIEPQSFEATYEVFLENIHPDDSNKVDKAYKKSLKNKIPYESEHRLLLKSGEVKYVLEKCNTEFDNLGNPIRSLGTVLDVTSQKLIEQNLVKALEKAEESDQLKTEFLSNMSHEIRTPMNGILGFSEMLGNSNLTNEKRANFVKIIQSSGQQLLHIIDDILEISRLGTKQVKVVKESVCINDVLLELFSIFEGKARENKTPLYLKKSLSNEQSTIFTDKLKLNKVFGNLLENALKFTVEGFVEFGYQLKMNSEPAELELYVRDTGIGIKQSKHKTIFERFSQAEKDLSKNVGGLGLGLSIAKENIELLGGTLRLESKIGEGATFFATIPYKPVYKDDYIDKYSTTPPTIKHKCTILIAEDEEMNYLYLETLLKDVIGVDCNIIHAINGQEAVEICKKNNAIDLVLMDLKMPVMNGIEATQQLKKIFPDLPVVAQTAYSTQSDRDKAVMAGCDDFMSKPISQRTMSKMLEKYLIKKIVNI